VYVFVRKVQKRETGERKKKGEEQRVRKIERASVTSITVCSMYRRVNASRLFLIDVLESHASLQRAEAQARPHAGATTCDSLSGGVRNYV